MTAVIALVTFCLARQSNPSTMLDVLNRDGHYKNFVALLKVTGLDHQVGANGGPGYTLFAVPDSAFAKLPKEARKALTTSDSSGSLVAATHLVAGKYGSISFINGISTPGQPLTHTIKAWTQASLTVTAQPTGLFIGKVKILREIYCSNGTIMFVDGFIPYEMPRPRGIGLEAIIPADLLKWGLGRYLPSKPLPPGVTKTGAIDPYVSRN